MRFVDVLFKPATWMTLVRSTWTRSDSASRSSSLIQIRAGSLASWHPWFHMKSLTKVRIDVRLYILVGWCLTTIPRDKDDMTVGVGHSRRYGNTGYDQSQGRRPSTLKCIGPISNGDIEPQPSRQKLIRNRTASRLRSDGRSRRYVQYRVDQSQTETMIADHPSVCIY